jgi:hypothetical protein
VLWLQCCIKTRLPQAAPKRGPQRALLLYFLRLGALGFGGPIALVGYMQRDLPEEVGSDPDFEAKAKDILGLYLHPPEKAAVFCIDEKTAIQALDRTQPALPLRPGRPERHTVEYVRHGTVSLFAALEVHSGKVLGRCAPRHTSEAFVEFLEEAVARHRRKTIHVILDNLSVPKTPAVKAWAATHPKVQFHFTPTYASWLN